MRKIADYLVFDLGWRPADLYALTLPEWLYWAERSLERRRSPHKGPQ